MRAGGSQSRPAAGFTLLELLVSLALSMLLLTIISAAVYQLGREWNRSQERMDAQLDLALMLLQIERSLIGAVPYHYRDQEKGESFVYFSGESDTLSWVSSVGPGERGGLTIWSLSLDEPVAPEAGDPAAAGDDEQRGVYLRSARAYVDNPAERLEDVAPVLIIAGYRLAVEYLLIVPGQDDKNEWLDEWDGDKSKSLPQAVRLTFENLDDEEYRFEVVAPIGAWMSDAVQPVYE